MEHHNPVRSFQYLTLAGVSPVPQCLFYCGCTKLILPGFDLKWAEILQQVHPGCYTAWEGQ